MLLKKRPVKISGGKDFLFVGVLLFYFFCLLMVKSGVESTAQCEGQVDQLNEGWNWVNSSTQLQAELSWGGPPRGSPPSQGLTR